MRATCQSQESLFRHDFEAAYLLVGGSVNILTIKFSDEFSPYC